jgi:hypothetical protein
MVSGFTGTLRLNVRQAVSLGLDDLTVTIDTKRETGDVFMLHLRMHLLFDQNLWRIEPRGLGFSVRLADNLRSHVEYRRLHIINVSGSLPRSTGTSSGLTSNSVRDCSRVGCRTLRGRVPLECRRADISSSFTRTGPRERALEPDLPAGSDRRRRLTASASSRAKPLTTCFVREFSIVPCIETGCPKLSRHAIYFKLFLKNSISFEEARSAWGWL